MIMTFKQTNLSSWFCAALAPSLEHVEMHVYPSME